MRKLLVLCVLAACSSGTTKDQSLKVFAAATTEMTTAQSSAVDAARAHASAVPAASLALDYSGPCPAGGTVAVTGSYDASGTGDHAVFDLSSVFTSCATDDGTLDGNLAWHSQADSTGFSETMTGSLSYQSASDSLSCDVHLTLAVDATSVTYGGTICGYDVQADLHL